MSKYRQGIAYLRPMKKGDKANDFRTAMRLALFADKSAWKRPQEIKPVVLVQHGVKGVAAVFMNRNDALSSMINFPKRSRNSKYSRKRGLRSTKSDFKKVWCGWKFKRKGDD